MSLALTFENKDLLQSPLVGADGTLHYMISSTRGLRGPKITKIVPPSGVVGTINWREKSFDIDGVQRKWDELKVRHGGIFSTEREWKWDHRLYSLDWFHVEKELLATPLEPDSTSGKVRFTPYTPHFRRKNDLAAVYFPEEMQDEVERMFLLMAILQSEMYRQEQHEAAGAPVN